jgi:hypothetical protein
VDFQEFVSKYTVHFGALPADLEDKIQCREWNIFISSIRPDQLDNIILKAGDAMGKSLKKPRIRDMRVAMGDEAPERVFFKYVDPCALCDDRGYLSVLMWIDPSKSIHDPKRHMLGHAGNRSRLYICSSPCKCSMGREIAQNQGISEDKLRPYWAWHDEFMEGCRRSGEPMWLRMKRLERESMREFGFFPNPSRIQLSPDLVTVPQDERPAAGVTVGHLLDKVLPAGKEVMGSVVREEVSDAGGPEVEGHVLRAGPTEVEGEAPDW